MHTLDELISKHESGWPLIRTWISSAKNEVHFFPPILSKSEQALVDIQLSTQSMIGSVVYETGGILVDHGWIRILGGGCDLFNRSLPGWNFGKTLHHYGDPVPYLLVADDVVGGFYAVNGGYFGNDKGNVYYFMPDFLEWQPLGIDYAGFLLFCFEEDLDGFYEPFRWKGWRDDVKQLKPDHGILFSPTLWDNPDGNVNIAERKTTTIEALYARVMDTMAIRNNN